MVSPNLKQQAKNSRKLIILVISLLQSIPAFAQSVDTAWARVYNRPGVPTDWAYAIALRGSRNVYVTGYSYGSGTEFDYFRRFIQ